MDSINFLVQFLLDLIDNNFIFVSLLIYLISFLILFEFFKFIFNIILSSKITIGLDSVNDVRDDVLSDNVHIDNDVFYNYSFKKNKSTSVLLDDEGKPIDL